MPDLSPGMLANNLALCEPTTLTLVHSPKFFTCFKTCKSESWHSSPDFQHKTYVFWLLPPSSPHLPSLFLIHHIPAPLPSCCSLFVEHWGPFPLRSVASACNVLPPNPCLACSLSSFRFWLKYMTSSGGPFSPVILPLFCFHFGHQRLYYLLINLSWELKLHDGRDCVFSPQILKYVGQCLAHSRCSVNVCWVNLWVSDWMLVIGLTWVQCMST